MFLYFSSCKISIRMANQYRYGRCLCLVHNRAGWRTTDHFQNLWDFKICFPFFFSQYLNWNYFWSFRERKNYFKGQFVCFPNSYEKKPNPKTKQKISQPTIDLLLQYVTSSKQLLSDHKLWFIQYIVWLKSL